MAPKHRQSGSVLNPADSEDSAEEIASSDEREDKEDEEDEDDAPEVGADGQPRVDRAYSTEPRASTSTATEGDHPEVHLPTCHTCLLLLLPRLPIYLSFSYLVVFCTNFVKFAQFHPRGLFKLC